MARSITLVNIMITYRKNDDGSDVVTNTAEGTWCDPNATNDADKCGGPLSDSWPHNAGDTMGEIKAQAVAKLKAKAGIS
jgi:hypothetical protein